jgi:hypothetical protein
MPFLALVTATDLLLRLEEWPHNPVGPFINNQRPSKNHIPQSFPILSIFVLSSSSVH